MPPVLAAAIATAYRVFAGYEARGRLEVCRCNVCMSDAAERALVTTPLRALGAAELAEYTHSAHGFSPQVADEFRHFLPRYFELIADDDPPSTVGIETCLDRLHETNYRSAWPAAEVACVDACFAALLRARLAAPLECDAFGLTGFAPDPVEALLCMTARAGGNLAALLAVFDGATGREASLHLAAMIASADWRKKRLRDSFWDGHRRADLGLAQALVMAWLIRPQTRERLEGACLAETEEGPAALLSNAESLVAGLMAAHHGD